MSNIYNKNRVTYMIFYDIWLKYNRFIFNITSKHITNFNEIELFLYLRIFYFTT